MTSPDSARRTEMNGTSAASAAPGSQVRLGRRAQYRDSLQRLRGAQKSSIGAAAYSRFINRPLGRRFAAMAHVTGLTPNTVTLISAAFTATAIVLIAVAGTTTAVGVGVALLLILGYALDSADGQLARLRGKGSYAGEWLDHMVDCTKLATIHLAVVAGLARSDSLTAQTWLLIPLGFSVVASVKFFGKILNDQLRRQRGVLGAKPEARPSLVRSLLAAPTDYGALMLVFVLWGFPTLFLAVYACLFLANLIYLLMALPLWCRVVSALDELDRN